MQENADVSIRKPKSRPKCRFAVTAHALIRYVERASRLPFDTSYLSLLRERATSGLAMPPTDGEVIAWIERGMNLDKYRRRLGQAADDSRIIYEGDTTNYRAAGNGLVLVTDLLDRRVMTVLTREQAALSVPRQVLVVEGLYDEDPLPTLSYDEIMRGTAFAYLVRGRKEGRLAERLPRIFPPVEIVAGAGTKDVVVAVRSRQSLEMMEREEGMTVAPYAGDRTILRALSVPAQ
jgi:hypothetical protein